MTLPDPGARDHAPPGIDRLLAGLTPEQGQAVTHGTGPLLLLAGPGALVRRRASIVLGRDRLDPRLEMPLGELRRGRWDL
jgi:hypothetical protein